MYMNLEVLYTHSVDHSVRILTTVRGFPDEVLWVHHDIVDKYSVFVSHLTREMPKPCLPFF